MIHVGTIGPDNKPILTNYVKRVIGLPGDRISLDGKNVIVNGQVLPEHRIDAIDHNRKDPLEIKKTPPRGPNETYDVYYRPENDEDDTSAYDVFTKAGNGKEVVVPAGKYFVMGDNRDNSEDIASGVVPRDLVIGRAMFVYWSYDESAPLWRRTRNHNRLLPEYAMESYRYSGSLRRSKTNLLNQGQTPCLP